MEKTYYVGKNGLEYLTEADAIKFGKGLKGMRVVGKSQLISVDDEPKHIEAQVELSEDTSVEYDELSDEEIKSLAKELGIRIGMSKRVNLIKKIEKELKA